MSNIKWNFLLLSILAVICIGSIGVFVAEKMWFGIIIALVLLCVVMGGGFTLKKKLREAGKLD